MPGLDLEKHASSASVPRRPAGQPERCSAPLPRDGGPDWERLLPPSWYARRGKRLLDLALVSAALPVAVVPGVCVALVNGFLFRDPRKILFRQERLGWRGRRFRIYKFRTMREAPRGEMDSWSNGHDHLRVTRFGRFLRNTHLDELPQLLNVLRGDMQLIGPRPEMVEVDAWVREHLDGFDRRLAIRPGITGLAQIVQGYTGRDVVAYRRKLGLDALYLRRVSLRTDAWILGRTLLWVVRGRGWKSWNARRRREEHGDGSVAQPPESVRRISA